MDTKVQYCSANARGSTVTAYLKSRQLLPFGFARRDIAKVRSDSVCDNQAKSYYVYVTTNKAIV